MPYPFTLNYAAADPSGMPNGEDAFAPRPGVPVTPRTRPGIRTTIYRHQMEGGPAQREFIFDESGMEIPGARARLEDRLGYNQMLMDAMQQAGGGLENSRQFREYAAQNESGQKALNERMGAEAQMTQAQADQSRADLGGRQLAWEQSPESEARQLRLGAPALDIQKKTLENSLLTNQAQADAAKAQLKESESRAATEEYKRGSEGLKAHYQDPAVMATDPLGALRANVSGVPLESVRKVLGIPEGSDLLTTARQWRLMNPVHKLGAFSPDNPIAAAIAANHMDEIRARQRGSYLGWSDYGPTDPRLKEVRDFAQGYVPGGETAPVVSPVAPSQAPAANRVDNASYSGMLGNFIRGTPGRAYGPRPIHPIDQAFMRTGILGPAAKSRVGVPVASLPAAVGADWTKAPWVNSLMAPGQPRQKVDAKQRKQAAQKKTIAEQDWMRNIGKAQRSRSAGLED